jgi:hypothetical protein
LLGAIYEAGDEVDRARKAVERTLSDPRMFHVYLAMAQAVGGSADEARAAMERYLQQHPEDEKATDHAGDGDAAERDEGCASAQGCLHPVPTKACGEAANGLP